MNNQFDSARYGAAFQPYDYEEVTVGAAAIGLTASKLATPSGARYVHSVAIRFAGGPIRIRVDGTDPTAAVGVPVYDTDWLVFDAQSASTLKMIRQGSTNGTARVTYYRV